MVTKVRARGDRALVADSGKAHFAQYRSGLKRFEDHPEPCSAQNCAGFSHQGTSSGHRARWCIIPHSLCMRVANGWAAPIPVYALNAALRARICAGRGLTAHSCALCRGPATSAPTHGSRMTPRDRPCLRGTDCSTFAPGLSESSPARHGVPAAAKPNRAVLLCSA